MQNTTILFATLGIAMLCGCLSEMNLYKQSQIDILVHTKQDQGMREIIFKVPLESMYYCPGAKLNEENGVSKLSFIRCKIKEKCQTEAISKDIGDGKTKLEFKAMHAKVVLVFEDGEKALD